MEWNIFLITGPHVHAPGHDLTIVTKRLGFLIETERKPNKRKLKKKIASFDLLTPDVIDIIKEMNSGIVHWEIFVSVVARLNITRNPELRTNQKNSWFSSK